MDYRQLLIYYLNSDEWDIEMDSFFELKDHCYDPYEGTEDRGSIYLCSEIYLEFERKSAEDGTSYWSLQLTQQQFHKYFDRRYTATQRFAVLFGVWFGLNEPQLRRIADLRQRKNCLYWLNYFLCNRSASPDIPMDELRSFRYAGKYVADIFDEPPSYTPPRQRTRVALDDLAQLDGLLNRHNGG